MKKERPDTRLERQLRAAIEQYPHTKSQLAKECWEASPMWKELSSKDADSAVNSLAASLSRFVNDDTDKKRMLSLWNAGLVAARLGLILSPAELHETPTQINEFDAVKHAFQLLGRLVPPEQPGQLGLLTYLAEIPERNALGEVTAELFGAASQRLQLKLDASDGIEKRKLYRDKTGFLLWKSRVERLRGEDRAVFSIPPSIVSLRRSDSDESLFAVEYGIAFPAEEGKTNVLGMYLDITDHEVRSRNTERFLDAYRNILDLDWAAICLHEVHRAGGNQPIVKRVNKRERLLLDISPDRKADTVRFSDFAYQDDVRHGPSGQKESGADLEERIIKKLDGGPLSENQSRTFLTTSTAGAAEPTTVPVNITDVPVDDARYPDKNRRTALITVVRDVRIRPDVTQLLRTFGARFSYLDERLNISTFVKAKRSEAKPLIERLFEYDRSLMELSQAQRSKILARVDGPDLPDKDELVFVYGNNNFVDRLKESNQGKVRVETMEDLLGRTEDHIFDELVALQYKDADRYVIVRGAEHQRMEEHPTGMDPNDKVWVQVLKTPLRVHEGAKPIGLHGFFWNADSSLDNNLADSIHSSFRPLAILDAIPVPVYRKDKELRITYANREYVANISKGKGNGWVTNLADIVGCRDTLFFPPKDARTYEEDDQLVLSGGYDQPHLRRRETHQGRLVHVTKTPIKDHDDKIVGLQGIFWNEELVASKKE